MDTEMLSEGELDDRLIKSNPANRASLEDEGVRAALVSVRRSVESRPGREAPSGSVRPSTYRRRWAVTGVATAVVAVVALVGVQALTGGNGSSGLPFAVPSAAAAQLKQVARAASGQGTPTADQWEYVAVKTENTDTNSAAGATIAYTYTQTQQSWIAADGVTRSRVTGNSFSFLTPQDKATYLAHQTAFDATYLGDGPMTTGVIEDKMFPSRETHQPVWETSPPSDPKTLLNDLWQQYASVMSKHATNLRIAGHAVTLNAFRPEIYWTELSSILLNSTSAKLRSTAYAALAYVSGTKVLGYQTDQLGRPGIAISWTSDGSQGNETLIVSPSTGDLLEEDTTSLRAVHGIPAGAVTMREIYLQRAIEGSDTALPGGGSQPFVPSSQG